MATKPIIYSKKDHVGWITLNRPAAGNSVDLAMAQEVAKICAQINGDEEVYLAVISGAGNLFCTGGDASQLVRPADDGEPAARLTPAEAIGRIDRPTLAAINGDALGMGLEIALACDIRLSSDKARLGLPQITEGQIPMDGGTQRLSRIVGKAKALEMVLTGEIINAPAAYEIGLVNKIFPPATLMNEVATLAKSLAAKAPIAMRYAREAVNKGMDLTLDQGLRLEADLYFLIHTTTDRTEGIHSFLHKRPPQYKGK